MSVAYLNGAFLPLEDVRISPLDRGFLFADGIYEVAAVIDGGLVDSTSHLARLERSTAAIGIPLPLSLDAIETAQKELVVRSGLTEGLVYLQITRGWTPAATSSQRRACNRPCSCSCRTRSWSICPA